MNKLTIITTFVKVGVSVPRSSATLGKVGVSVPRSSVTLGKVGVSVPRSSATLGEVEVSVPRSSTTLGKVEVSVPRSSVTLGKVEVSVPRSRMNYGKVHACLTFCLTLSRLGRVDASFTLLSLLYRFYDGCLPVRFAARVAGRGLSILCRTFGAIVEKKQARYDRVDTLS